MSSLFLPKCKKDYDTNKDTCDSTSGVLIAIILIILTLIIGIYKWYLSDLPTQEQNIKEAQDKRNKGRDKKILLKMLVICLGIIIIVPYIVKFMKR